MRGGGQPGFAFGEALFGERFEFGQIFFAMTAEAGFLDAEIR
ncbi:MAG TPA: hypothetical protein VLI55_03355 [Bryobacteraceae bacterium]|nr:hypothetical protein [Bryobacteraceae bacterium]